MTQLPPGWAETTLPQIISDGGLISDGDWVESKDQDPDGDIRLIQLADIGDGIFKDKSSRYMNQYKADLLKCTFLESGDVLIARMPDPLGRACIFSGIKVRSVTVVDVCLVRLPEGSGLLSKVLMYWINSPDIRNKIEMQATGTTRKRITRKNLSALKLPIPPLPEQIRIANKLDSLLAKVETAQTRLEKIPALLKRFRQAVLAAATSGELTREWREDKKSNVIQELKLIKLSRESEFEKNSISHFESTGKKLRNYDFSTLSENISQRDVPSEWTVVQLGEIISFLTDYHANGSYEVLKKKVELKENKDYACMIRATNFEKNNFDDLMIYISKDAYEFLSKSKLYGGEILIGKIGNAGFVYHMPKINKPASLAMNLFALRFNENLVSSNYIYIFLKSNIGEENIQKYVKGVATKSIDKISLRSVFINLCTRQFPLTH